MTKADRSAEPSIEEILASIRSIIADDGATNSRNPVRAGSTPPLGGPDLSSADPRQTLPESLAEVAAQQAGMQRAAAEGCDNGEEVLELTEDFMLAEALADQDPHTPSAQAPNPAPLPGESRSGQSFPDAVADRLQDEDDLDEVLSNLAAEVERLSAPEKGAAPALPLAEDAILPEADAVSGEAVQAQADEFDMNPDAPEEAAPTGGNLEFEAGRPQVDGLAAPQAVAPSAPLPMTAPPSVAVKPKKQIWSARRLEARQDQKPSPPPAPDAPEEESMSAPQHAAAPNEAALADHPAATDHAEMAQQPASTLSNRDFWAEGVQMPVPESGPQMPLPAGSGGGNAEAGPRGREQPGAAKTAPDLESARQTVGGFLSRVFASRGEESETVDEAASKSRAEQLAQETIADFAREKLNAPAVGDVLKSDKAFMKEVADSLESALAEPDRREDQPTAASLETQPGQVLPDRPEERGATLIRSQPALPEISGQNAASVEAQASEPSISLPPIAPEAEADASPDSSYTEQLPAEDVGSGPQDEGNPSPAAASGEMEGDTAPLAAPKLELPEESGKDSASMHLSERVATGKLEETAAETDPASVGAKGEPDSMAQDTALLSAGGLPSSLESSIKEMIKPLIIQWLNDNLPRIVEEAVREELAGQSALTEIRKAGHG